MRIFHLVLSCQCLFDYWVSRYLFLKCARIVKVRRWYPDLSQYFI